MKKGSTLFLQAVVVVIGIGTLAFLLGEPHVEGRNQHATLFEIYFKDPFLAYVYLASLAYFVALYQAFKMLGYARLNHLFSPEALKVLRTIKYCALCLIGFVAGSVIFLPFGDPDDRPQGIMMRIVFTFGAVVVAAAVGVCERFLENALEIKSENDLTV